MFTEWHMDAKSQASRTYTVLDVKGPSEMYFSRLLNGHFKSLDEQNTKIKA